MVDFFQNTLFLIWEIFKNWWWIALAFILFKWFKTLYLWWRQEQWWKE